MTDVRDLQARIDHFEQAICGFDDTHRDLLSGIQEGLNTVRDRLIDKKVEIDRLTQDNHHLRQVIDRLLDSVESKAKGALHDKLKDLDIQLSVLLEVSEDGAAAAVEVAGESLAEAPESNQPIDEPEEPTSPATAEPIGYLVDESSALSDIQGRVRRLAEQLPAADGQAREPVGNGERHDSEPGPVKQEEQGDARADTAPEDHAALSFDKEKPSAASTQNRERKGFNRLIEAPARTVRSVLPKARMRFDAEVEYALGVLRQMRRLDQTFCAEDVRELINGKFDLGLTARDDKQITASLLKREFVKRNPVNDAVWNFLPASGSQLHGPGAVQSPKTSSR